MSWGWWVVLGVSAVLLLAAIANAVYEHRSLRRAVFVDGTVVELRPKTGKGGVTFAPVVRYAGPDGRERTFESGFSSSSPAYQLGDTVPVACDPRTGAGSIASFGVCFGFSVVATALSAFGFLLTAGFVLGYRWFPAWYLPAR